MIDNRPSLPQVQYRLGTFGSFREAMLDRIAIDPVLHLLASRAEDEHVVTFVELWAAVADVLTFHQERYANEVWLGTATEQRSVQRLAQLIGYRPRPGLAAEAWLAFVLDAAATVSIPKGFAVQSVPGAGESPQTYETLEPLTGDGRLDALHAHVLAFPSQVPFASGSTRVLLKREEAPAVAATLHAGDRVALWGTGVGQFEERVIADVAIGLADVAITWTTPTAGTAGSASAPAARRTVRRLDVFGADAPKEWVSYQTVAASGSTPKHFDATIHATDATVSAHAPIELVGKVDDVAPGTELLALVDGKAHLVTVTAMAPTSSTVAGITAPVTSVTVTPELPALDRRNVRILLLAGPPIEGWGTRYPSVDPGSTLAVPAFVAAQIDGSAAVELGRTIDGDRWVPGQVVRLDELAPGRPLLVVPGPPDPASPAPAPRDPIPATLLGATVAPANAPARSACHLVLELHWTDGPPTGWGAAGIDSATILGNVVRASHGETKAETLGDGDAALPFARFTLRHHPLTYLAAAVPGGAESTLELAVDGVRRDEVPTLFGQPGTAPVLTATTTPLGTTEIELGDGDLGAPATTGRANVTARYRVGSGTSGRVRADRLTTILRPLPGVTSVSNPSPAEGGADPEPLAEARTGAPRTVRTLGRAVSLRDLQDLVTESGLVAKALATWVWDGYERAIHLTVAAQGGTTLSSAELRDLASSLDRARDVNRKLRIANFVTVPVQLHASVVVDPRVVDAAAVVENASRAATDALSFAAGVLGRSLNLSDIVSVLAAVPGVLGVDADVFGFRPSAALTSAELDLRGVERRADGTVAPVQGRLRVFAARPPAPGQVGLVVPAELALLANPAEDLVVTSGAMP